MKILTIVGARPQFIKAAVVSHVLNQKHEEILVHTGQHFDYNMSDQFFEELSIPNPKYNLGISGGTHAQMTGKMLIAIEDVLFKENPDLVLLYGDTNSTLSAALAAAKLHIPICHVEAGTRTHSKTNPEEINRVCTDHISTLLLTSTKSGLSELAKEGISRNAFFVGDPMFDAFIEYGSKVSLNDFKLTLLNGSQVDIPRNFYYLTCHREENTSNDTTLANILKAMNSLEYPTIYPVHPRNRRIAKEASEKLCLNNILLVEPVGYVESICLTKNAKKIVTDSGGLQREAFFSQKQCVTVLNFVVWPETMIGNRNSLAMPNEVDILEKLSAEQTIEANYQPFGDGHSAIKIVNSIEKWWEENKK